MGEPGLYSGNRHRHIPLPSMGLWEREMSHSVFVIEGLEVKIILTDFLLCRGGGAVAVL